MNADQSSAKVTSKDIRKCIIWGNHSSTQVPDVTHVDVDVAGKIAPLMSLVQDKEWVEGKLVKDVQERGAAIIKARKLSSAMSAAAAVGAHLRDWFRGTADGEYVSMAVVSDGNKYGVPEGLIYSFPVKCLGKGEYEIVQNVPVDARIKEMQAKTTQELIEERNDAEEILATQ